VAQGDLVLGEASLALQKDSSLSPMHCGGICILSDLTSAMSVLVMAPRKHSLGPCLRIRDWSILVSINANWTVVAGASLWLLFPRTQLSVYSVLKTSTILRKDIRVHAIANMLLVNKYIDEVPFRDEEAPFDRVDWDALVARRVECNLYRKRLSPIPKVKALSTRAVVVGRALVRVQKKPSLVWMVLSQSYDVICSCLLNEARDVSASVPSRKRGRSLMLRSAH
jgi:hypothetical protein